MMFDVGLMQKYKERKMHTHKTKKQNIFYSL